VQKSCLQSPDAQTETEQTIMV